MRHARQCQSQVCGVHGRASSGLGQQLHVRPLSNPEPGARVISPGRRVVRRLTRPHRPWPACQAPTNQPRRRARPSRNRMARPPYAPADRPAGHGLDAANGPKISQGRQRHRIWCRGSRPYPSCLGDNCQSSAQTGPAGSRQLRLGRHSVECGLVGCSRAWWNDRGNDQLSKRRDGTGSVSGSCWQSRQAL
jgi:hypothetical protein